MSHRPLTALTIVAAAVALTGCGQTLEERVATAVVTSALETTRNGGAARQLVELEERDANGCITDPAAAAADAASRPPNGLFPEGCLAKTAEGSTLYAQFNGCTGVFGKVQTIGNGCCRRSVGPVDSSFCLLASLIGEGVTGSAAGSV